MFFQEFELGDIPVNILLLGYIYSDYGLKGESAVFIKKRSTDWENICQISIKSEGSCEFLTNIDENFLKEIGKQLEEDFKYSDRDEEKEILECNVFDNITKELFHIVKEKNKDNINIKEKGFIKFSTSFQLPERLEIFISDITNDEIPEIVVNSCFFSHGTDYCTTSFLMRKGNDYKEIGIISTGVGDLEKDYLIDFNCDGAYEVKSLITFGYSFDIDYNEFGVKFGKDFDSIITPKEEVYVFDGYKYNPLYYVKYSLKNNYIPSIGVFEPYSFDFKDLRYPGKKKISFFVSMPFLSNKGSFLQKGWEVWNDLKGVYPPTFIKGISFKRFVKNELSKKEEEEYFVNGTKVIKEELKPNGKSTNKKVPFLTDKEKKVSYFFKDDYIELEISADQLFPILEKKAINYFSYFPQEKNCLVIIPVIGKIWSGNCGEQDVIVDVYCEIKKENAKIEYREGRRPHYKEIFSD